MDDNNTRIICTLGIWVAVAFTFIFGVFRFSWQGESAGFIWMVVAISICLAAAYGTKAIWSALPRRPESRRESGKDADWKGPEDDVWQDRTRM